MNAIRWLLVVMLIVFALLFAVSRVRAMRYARVVTLLIVGAVMLLPFLWLAAAAFKDKAVLNEYLFFPPPGEWSAKTVNLDNFRTLLAEKDTVQGTVTFWRYVLNSLFIASAGTSLSLIFSSLGGYALAKYRFRGRGLLMTFMLASVTIPGVVLLAPNVELIWRFGWMDQYRALLIPAAVSVFGMFLFRQAMVGVPDEIIEAGRLDGCGEFRIYLTLIMPLVRPMTGAFCLVSFLGAWNSFIVPNIFLQSQRKLPLPVVLNQYVGEYSQQYGVFLAGTILAITLPAILFFALQRELISGLTSGAVKQ